jgi:hypothetical protein
MIRNLGLVEQQGALGSTYPACSRKATQAWHFLILSPATKDEVAHSSPESNGNPTDNSRCSALDMVQCDPSKVHVIGGFVHRMVLLNGGVEPLGNWAGAYELRMCFWKVVIV